MAKNYKGSFNYSAASNEYDVTMKRRGLPWWAWLIIGLILAFIASLFIRWDRQLTVKVVDELNRPVEQADVAVSYTARFCPWLTDDIALHGVTGEDGKVVIKGMSVSVWSYLFYHFEPVTVKGEKGSAHDEKEVPLHATDEVVLVLKMPAAKMEFDVRVIDAFTSAPIAGAELLVTVNGNGRPGVITTGGDGKARIGGVTDRDIISVAARHPKYEPNDTTIYNVPGIELRNKMTDIPLEPKVVCNQQVNFGGHTPETRTGKIDLGKSDVDFDFYFETYSYPDQVTVYDENNNKIYDSGDISTDGQTVRLHSPTRYIYVQVNSYGDGIDGTEWAFMVKCPD